MVLPQSILLGPLVMTTYGLIVTAAVLIAYALARYRTRLYQVDQKVVDDFLPSTICWSIIGARLYHVFDKWSYYRHFPLEILAVWHGGLAIYGAIIGGVISLALFAKRRQLSLVLLLDLVAPSALLGQAIGRFGNYANQEAFGHPTSLPWGIFIEPDKRPWFWQNQTHFQPLFLYESVLDVCGFFLLVTIARKLPNRPGAVFGLYLIYYGLTRLLVEQWRFDTAVVGPLKVATILSLVSILVGSVLLVRAHIAKIKNQTAK